MAIALLQTTAAAGFSRVGLSRISPLSIPHSPPWLIVRGGDSVPVPVVHPPTTLKSSFIGNLSFGRIPKAMLLC